MTEHIAALDALIEAVGAGEPGWNRFATKAEDAMPLKAAALSASAYCGSLDAAKALHEALLHERVQVSIQWSIRYGAVVMVAGAGGTWEGNTADNPARAWLLAILKAYRAGL